MEAVVFVILVVAVLLLCGKPEGFILGSAAPYKTQYNECLNQCVRSDPNKRFLSQANVNCGRYCDSVISDMARLGVPPSDTNISNSMTKCEKQCGGDTPEQRKCLKMCYGQNEVAQWCKELWCPYSLSPNDKCMRRCFSTWTANNNQFSGWKWR